MIGRSSKRQAIQRVFSRLVPDGVAVCVAEIGTVDDLLPSERALVANAVTRRRDEFAAGRWCARRALAAVGSGATAIGRGPLHEPSWPVGFSGSITHDRRFAAAIAYRCDVRPAQSIGIDLIDQPAEIQRADVAGVVLSERDRAVLSCEESSGLALARIFSAKEAAIKILSSRAGTFLEFRQLSVLTIEDGFVVEDAQTGLAVTVHLFSAADVIISVAMLGEPDV